MDKERFSTFTRRVLEVIGLVALALFLWQIANALLLLYLGLLLAVFLHGLSGKLQAHTPLSRQSALAAVGLVILGLVGFGGWLLGSEIAQQARQLPEQLSLSASQIRQYAWGDFLLKHLPNSFSGMTGNGIFYRITGVLSTAGNVLTSFILVIFVGIYFVVQPELYQKGFVQLFPEERRSRIREVLDTTGRALWLWLLAQLVSMTIIGILTWVGLKLLGVRMALLLGLIAGVLEFIPFFGPFLAAIPAVLVALLQGPMQALYVLLLYLGIQQVESNLITPLVQEKGVSIPPVVTLMAAVAFGILFGVPGILVATPLAVALLVLIKMLYVEDVLGSPTYVPGRQEASAEEK